MSRLEELMALHHKAADARVKLLNTHHAGLGMPQELIEAKQDADAALKRALRDALEPQGWIGVKERARSISIALDDWYRFPDGRWNRRDQPAEDAWKLLREICDGKYDAAAPKEPT